MRIGNLLLKNKFFLAPMAGFTDKPFRILAKEAGCGLVYSEMISDKGLLYNNSKTLEMLSIEETERPIAIQIFGSEPETMAEAAKIVEAKGADIIDINMGCPVLKVVKNGSGSMILRDPILAYKIMREVVRAVDIPVTVKIRKGWSKEEITGIEVARLAQAAGVSAVAVHGRTREEFYSGKADWEFIGTIKEQLGIPVIGNGDVCSLQDAVRMIVMTACDGVMIGRGALGNPFIFKQINHYLETKTLLPEPTLIEKMEMLLRHFNLLVAYEGEYSAVRKIRSHGTWYTKGLPGSTQLRVKINNTSNANEFIELIEEYVSKQVDLQ
ncbi:tRNA dihydrouridine synthase DusB [Selenomonadales bacterium OttesenSCG-928-I06]|nr:tRNA dihydrouridine synthase DusB [Selenomonadales bacterium OttesenSCG-928-I06]